MQSIHFQRLGIFFALLLAVGCQKELGKIYEVNRQQVSLTNIDKEALKAEIEFVANAHIDLFGKPIENFALNQTLSNLAASNDKQLVIDLVIRQMLNRADLPVPTDVQMRADLAGFVQKMYKQFYRREPNPFEALKLKQLIEADSGLSPVMVYYSFLTSDEYRFF